MTQPPKFSHRDAADPAFWDERFAQGHMPWDAHGVPADFRVFVETQPAPLATLIPGCGNAYEGGWLAERGWPVVAIDFAPAAVEAARAVLGPHADIVREADFFLFELPWTPGLIYERAFLCALPPRLRTAYAARVAELLSPGALLAGYFFLRDTPNGPPFGISLEALHTLLGNAFTLLEDRPATDSIPVFQGHERWQVWQRKSGSL